MLGYAFRDGHFHVRPVTEPQRAWIPSSSDFWVVRDGERWLVSDVRGDSAAYRQGVRPGWEVVAMDDRPIAGLARGALAPLMAKPDAAQLEYAANVVTTGRLGEPRSFTFRYKGRPQRLALPPRPAKHSAAP
jgi:carboxyl-terminal processing protease